MHILHFLFQFIFQYRKYLVGRHVVSHIVFGDFSFCCFENNSENIMENILKNNYFGK